MFQRGLGPNYVPGLVTLWDTAREVTQRQTHNPTCDKCSEPGSLALPRSARADSRSSWAKTTLREAANLRGTRIFQAHGLLVSYRPEVGVFSPFPVPGPPGSICRCSSSPSRLSPRNEDGEGWMAIRVV